MQPGDVAALFDECGTYDADRHLVIFDTDRDVEPGLADLGIHGVRDDDGRFVIRMVDSVFAVRCCLD